MAAERAKLQEAHRSEVAELVLGAQHEQRQLQTDCEGLLSEAREQLRTREVRLSALATRCEEREGQLRQVSSE